HELFMFCVGHESVTHQFKRRGSFFSFVCIRIITAIAYDSIRLTLLPVFVFSLWYQVGLYLVGINWLETLKILNI
ncbi:MAG: hypothetical protein ACO20S_07865, partial [Paracoccaceae bacterium]